jgi:hypothetical protein
MKERIVSIGILVFALVYLAGSISLKVGTLAQPGAGQFPAVIAVCLLAAAAYNAWRVFRSRETAEEGKSWSQLAPAGIALVLVVYPLLLKTLSFLISTFLALFLMFRLLRFRTTLFSLLTALLTTLMSFVLFAGFLGVVVPGGAMEQFILAWMEKG